MSPWFYGSIAVSLHATVYFVYFLFALFVAMGRNRQNKRKREAAAAEEAKNPEVSTVAGVASSSSERPLPPMTQLDPPPLDTGFNFATQPCTGEAGLVKDLSECKCPLRHKLSTLFCSSPNKS